ncbi:MAG: transposase, partial [Minisyncoccia bacterium]
EQDYKHFQYLMYICNSERSISLRTVNNDFDKGESIVEIGAYCLMPNHFHILILEIQDGGISIYMRKLLTAYSMYFNKKYERTGKLYEGVFKSEHVDSDRYLKYLYSYIHLNPAKIIDKNWRESKTRNTSRIINYVFSYEHSSLQEYLKEDHVIVNSKNFPTYFKKPVDHKKELFEWLRYME